MFQTLLTINVDLHGYIRDWFVIRSVHWDNRYAKLLCGDDLDDTPGPPEGLSCQVHHQITNLQDGGNLIIEAAKSIIIVVAIIMIIIIHSTIRCR